LGGKNRRGSRRLGMGVPAPWGVFLLWDQYLTDKGKKAHFQLVQNEISTLGRGEPRSAMAPQLMFFSPLLVALMS
jgi:hypothetical protein